MDLLAFESTKAAFDRGAPRWKEGLWMLVRAIFFLTPLPWPSSWRAACLRLFGSRIGRGTVIRSGVNVTFPWRFELGDHSWLGEDVLILSLAPVRVGSHCCVSQRAFLCTGSHDPDQPAFDLVIRPVILHDRSWVAASCFVAPGVTIGPDAVAAAGSVVTRDIPPFSIHAGNPARFLRPLLARPSSP